MSKQILAIDLDGIIINSLKNMKIAWESTSKSYCLNISFKAYKKYLGLPFKEILKKNGVYYNHKNISNYYNKISLKNFNVIKVYKNVIETLNILKKSYLIVIITSKNRLRAKKILKLKKIPYDDLVTPDDVLRGKPYNDSILYIKKKYLVKNNAIVYVGDLGIDYKFAKNSKIKFIFANWGYGKPIGKFTVTKPKGLVKMVSNLLKYN